MGCAFANAPFIGELSPESDNPFTSIAGLPGIVVPAGFTSTGLPVGLEISGEPFSEALLLGFAYDYEQATQHRNSPTSVPSLLKETENPMAVQVSLSTSTSFDGDLNALIEDQGTALTVRFDLDEPAPEGGLKVYVDSEIEQIFNRLDLPGFAFNPITENINPSNFGTNFDNSGFVLTIDAGATSASFTINVFDNPEPDTFLPATFDGLVEAVFALKTQDQVDPADQGDVSGLSDYTIDPNAAVSTVLFADVESQLSSPPEPPEPPAPVLPLVSLHTGPNSLNESDGTVSAHVFNVTGLPLPEEGLVVSLSAPSLSEFDLSEIEVIDGEIVAVRDGGFDLRLTDFTTLINLPIASDSTAEGSETAVFTLEAGERYAINSDYSVGRFNLADTAADAPVGPDEPNDTIPLAIDTGLSADNPSVILSGSLDFDIGNRYINEDGSFTYIDATEDVDFYKVSLSAGDIVAFDLEAVVKDNPTIPDLVRDRTQASAIFRLFDAEGNELATRDLGQGPGELFATSTDPYLEFQAPADGDYYLGISVFTNGTPYRFGGDQFGDPLQYIERSYDPFVPDSGDGDARGGLDFRGIGGYDLEITLNPDNPVMLAEQRDRSNNRPPDVVDVAAPGEPVVSLDFLAATYDPDDNLIDDNLVEGLENQGSILTLIIETEGEISPEGILVTINSDTYLRDYYTVRTLVSAPFTPGAELIDVVTDDTGRETGLQLRVFAPKTFLPLNAMTQLRGEVLELETNGPETATFFLEGGEGYGVSATNNQITATFYDTPGQAPTLNVIPEVSMAISETTLIETEGTETTLTFTLDEAPPPEGVIVYVKANAPVLSRFDVLNAEISGGAFPFPNGNFDGFYFKITEPEASITLSTFENPLEEGVQSYRLALQETSFYTLNSDADAVSFTIADAPNSVPVVNLSAEPTVLIESEATESLHTFTLSAPPPEGGITVLVDAPTLTEFALTMLTTTGGVITAVTETGFSFQMTEMTATIALPIASDDDAEGVEVANFSLVESADYLIAAGEDTAAFTVVDIPEQVPAPAEETGPNETIPDAIFLNLNPENPSATIRSGLLPREAGVDRADYRDFSEDVDFYTFEALAGSMVTIDVDAIAFETARFPGVEQRLDSELRLFDSEGNELTRVNNAAAPDEDLGRDPYLEFIVPEDGQYYIGLSQLGNRNYDPFVERSGSGWIFPEIGVFSGEYDLKVSLASAPEINVYDFEWMGQIAGFSVQGEFSYDASLSYEDGIVREEDLLGFDISFFDPEGNLLRTYEDNHLTFDEFNFAFDTTTQELLQDGYFLGADGFNFGEKTAVGDGFSGLNFWSRPEFNSQGQVPPPHVHIDDWADEFGFPLGFSSHEDVAFFTRTTANRIETGRVGETYIDGLQDSLDEFGQRIQVFEEGTLRLDIVGTGAADTLVGDDRRNGIDGQGGNDTIAGGLGDDVILGGDGEDVLRGDLNSRSSQGNEAGGDDIIFGGDGNDRIGGKSGNDILSGDAGDDQIWGDDGDDILMGVTGNDILTGDNGSSGSGSDTFVFGNGDGTDTITDFEVGIDFIGLVDGELVFADLTITQDGANTLLGVTSTNERLAILNNVQASALDASSFIILPDVSNPQAALALV